MYSDFEAIIYERRLSLYQISKDTGIPLSTLYTWKSRSKKNPKTMLSIVTLKKLAKYLRIPVERLM